ncbi:MAG: hypothetical protein HQL11_05885, partial [Candidatus Omnitrophica bacterium]|nr:hypothetical protein [Candidatus Omnitrophota bacterium]
MSMASELGRVRSMKSHISAKQAKIRQLDTAMQRAFFWTDLLSEISDSMIQGVWLYQMDKREVEVEGVTQKEAAGAEPRRRGWAKNSGKPKRDALFLKGRMSMRTDQAA